MCFNTLLWNFVIIAVVVAGRAHCFLVDTTVRWASDAAMPDRDSILVCVGENLELPWEFSPGSATVVDIEWHFENAHQSSSESLIATLVSGHFFVESHASGRLEYLSDAGIRVLNLQPRDSGNYSVKINVRGSNVDYMRSVMVQVTTSPITSSERLHAYMKPAPIYTDQYHLVLSCGFSSAGWISGVNLVWQTPSHRLLQSSYHSGGNFDLYVPNPLENGQYTCLIDSSSSAGQCIPYSSPLLSGASVHVNATEGTISLMQALIERQQSLIQSLTSQIKFFFSLVLTGGRNSHEGRVEIKLWTGSYGTVCDDSWSDNDAVVVCKMMGYPYANAQAWSSAHFGEGTGPILLDDVTCQGSENHLLECNHRAIGTHDCQHGEDAGVTCQ